MDDLSDNSSRCRADREMSDSAARWSYDAAYRGELHLPHKSVGALPAKK